MNRDTRKCHKCSQEVQPVITHEMTDELLKRSSTSCPECGITFEMDWYENKIQVKEVNNGNQRTDFREAE